MGIKSLQDGSTMTIVVGEVGTSRLQTPTSLASAAIWMRNTAPSSSSTPLDFFNENSVTRRSDVGLNDVLFAHATFGSHHAGGAHFLLGDGSVRFLSENIDRGIFENLGSIADGNVIGEF